MKKIEMMEEYILYFKSLVNREEDALPWHQFWEINKAGLEKCLSRGTFLRLKTYPAKEIYKILLDFGHVYPEPQSYAHWKFHKPRPIPTSWLKDKIDENRALEVLNNRFSEKLKAILEKMEPNDEFWNFSSPKNTSTRFQGIAIVRLGKGYDHIVTKRASKILPRVKR